MGDVILITGASAGIGGLRRSTASSGWTVFGASRRGTVARGLDALVMDVDDDASVAAGIDVVQAEAGHLDAVVAAAGWGLAGAGRAHADRRRPGPRSRPTSGGRSGWSSPPCRPCDARGGAGSS